MERKIRFNNVMCFFSLIIFGLGLVAIFDNLTIGNLTTEAGIGATYIDAIPLVAGIWFGCRSRYLQNRLKAELFEDLDKKEMREST